MPYTNGDGTYHDRRRCRRLHNTGGRIRRVDPGDRDPCEHCADDAGPDTCTVELTSGGTCGREKPCVYHDD